MLEVMNELMYKAFADEMSKIAVSVDQLGQMARRMPKLRTKMRTGLVDPERMMNPGVSGDLKQMMGHIGLGAVAKPQQVMSNVKRMLGDTPVSALPAEIRNQLTGAMQASRKAGGTVLMPTGGMAGQMQRTSRGFKAQGAPKEMVEGIATRSMSPQGKRALNLTGIGHEAAERTTHPDSVLAVASHLSPDVLLREHNMLSRLTGPGSAEASNFMRAMRRQSGEGTSMQDFLDKMYPSKGSKVIMPEYGQGAKITKAMRKDLRRRIASGEALRTLTEG